MRAAAILTLLAALLTGCGEKEDERERSDDDRAAQQWTYEDVGAWGDTCASGTEQSPVDLADATRQDLADPELAYTASAATVVDTGHSVQTTLAGAGTMTLDGKAYTLTQFHFHTPSEHRVDGRAYAAEMHLVHQAEDGSLAVLGVLVEEGPALPVVDDVLANAPEEGGDPVPTTEPVDPRALLPDDLRAYRYSGSLTTPPCTEGVAWAVLREPVTWSPEQIEQYAGRHPDSRRPTQPLGERVLLQDTG
ncbi:carbonic anhydrase [Nocardioides hungaricus]